jgi:hypothetical protein
MESIALAITLSSFPYLFAAAGTSTKSADQRCDWTDVKVLQRRILFRHTARRYRNEGQAKVRPHGRVGTAF